MTDTEFQYMLDSINKLPQSLNSSNIYSIPIHLNVVNKGVDVPPEAYPVEKIQAAIEQINGSGEFGDILFHLCSVTFLNDPNYFFDHTMSLSDLPNLASTYNEPDVLNVYLYENGINWGRNLVVFPTSSGVFVSTARVGTFAHEIGHFLGLAHTFRSTQADNWPVPGRYFVLLRTDNSYNSFVDPGGAFCTCSSPCICTASNSGDMIADTNVDPGPAANIQAGIATGTIICGDESPYEGCEVTHIAPSGATEVEVYYPDPTNIMSYYNTKESFTDGQRNRMEDFIDAFAMNLVGSNNNSCTSFPSPNVLGIINGNISTPSSYDQNLNVHEYTPLHNFAIEQKELKL